MGLSTLLKGGKRALLRKDPIGKFVAELQDVADARISSGSIGVSFESGEVGALKFYCPFAATIKKVRLQVNKAIESTDDATVTLKDSGGNTMTGGTVTVTKSSAFGAEFTITPTAKNVVVKDDYFSITGAKTTAGGKCIAIVEYSMNLPAPQQP